MKNSGNEMLGSGNIAQHHSDSCVEHRMITSLTYSQLGRV